MSSHRAEAELVGRLQRRCRQLEEERDDLREQLEAATRESDS